MIFAVSKCFPVCRVSVEVEKHIRDNKTGLIDIDEKLLLIHGAKICGIVSGFRSGHGWRTAIGASGTAVISYTLTITTVPVQRQAPPLPQNGMHSSGNTVPSERAVAWS